MRQLYLQNQNGVKYNFNSSNKTLITSLSNFGIQNNISYFDYNLSYKTAKITMPMLTPSGTIIFLEGYAGYQKFLEYLYSSTSLRLYYNSVDLKYCEVDILSIDKNELKNGVLQCPIKFNKKTPWMKEVVIEVSVIVEEGIKSYSYSYSYKYKDSMNGVIVVNNRGSEKAPLDYEIKGYLNNPTIKIYDVNDNLLAESSFTINAENASLKVISEETKEEMTLTDKEGNKTNVYQLQDFTKDSFLFLPRGESKIVINSGNVDENSSYKITFIERYSGN